MYSAGKVLCCSQVGQSNVATASLAWQLRLQASRRCIQFKTESRSDKTAAAAASSYSWTWKLRFFMSVTSHNNSHLFKDSNGSKPDSFLSFSATNAIISLLITSPDSNHKKEKRVAGGGPPVKREGASTAILFFFFVTVNKTFFFLFQGQKQHRVLRLNTFRPPIRACHTTKNHLFPAMAQIVTLLENFLSHRFGENLQLQWPCSLRGKKNHCHGAAHWHDFSIF